MKKNIMLTALLLSGIFSAQQEHSVYIKGNGLLIPVGIVNIGAEYQLNHRYTVQADMLISPWKSFSGNHLQIYMGHLEGRYYFDQAFKHWYLGANVGAGIFDLTKWNYLDSGKFQRGFNYMLGATGGYQFNWKENWNVDVFLGVGTSQGFYHGYENTPPSFTRYDKAKGWNKSGELIPYRGGIMISYKIK